MKRLLLIAMAVLFLIIENSLLPSYSIMGGYPSILFVFAIAFSIINGKEDAIFIGIVTGFLQDIFFINGFGINLFTNFILCLLAAVIGESILKKNKLIPVISCFVLSVIKIFIVSILFIPFKRVINIDNGLMAAVLNSILMFISYKTILTTSKKYWKKDEWRFR